MDQKRSKFKSRRELFERLKSLCDEMIATLKQEVTGANPEDCIMGVIGLQARNLKVAVIFVETFQAMEDLENVNRPLSLFEEQLEAVA